MNVGGGGEFDVLKNELMYCIINMIIFKNK